MMENKQPNFYAIIPASVRYCEALPANAKLLYGELTALATTYGHCWASNEYFATLYQVNNKTVSLWIKALKDLGFIQVEIQDYYLRKIYISDAQGMEKNVIPPGKKGKGGMEKNVIPPGKKGKGGMEKNVIQSITINNTINNTSEAALDFLNKNYPGRMEAWEMKNKNQIQEYKRFTQEFNSTVDIEELKFNDRVLFARLDKYARAWIRNQTKFNNNPNQAEAVPVYLRKCQ
jgi:hypothetical protein